MNTVQGPSTRGNGRRPSPSPVLNPQGGTSKTRAACTTKLRSENSLPHELRSSCGLFRKQLATRAAQLVRPWTIQSQDQRPLAQSKPRKDTNINKMATVFLILLLRLLLLLLHLLLRSSFMRGSSTGHDLLVRLSRRGDVAAMQRVCFVVCCCL